MVLCHQGSTNGPPEHLKVGDVIDVQGKPWALVRIGSGFAAVAYQFRPHRDPTFHAMGGNIPPRFSIALNYKLAQETFDAIKAALDVPEFMNSTPRELRYSFLLIEHAWNKTKSLIAHLQRCYKNETNPDRMARLAKQLDLVSKAMKQVSYQRKDAQHFCRHYLGERP
jgi:hypothetical protein